MKRKYITLLESAAVDKETLAREESARGGDPALRGRQVEVEAEFKEMSGGRRNLLSAPKVVALAGEEASFKVVTEWLCPNGEVVEEGVILNVTPLIETGSLVLKGSALVVENIASGGEEGRTPAAWVGFKEVKTYFSLDVKDPDELYCLGSLQRDGQRIVVRLKARLLYPSNVPQARRGRRGMSS